MKLHSQEFESLWAAVEHWLDNYTLAKTSYLVESDIEGKSCPLCARYHPFNSSNTRCKGCPVMIATGESLCLDSPWYDVLEEIENSYKYDNFEYLIECVTNEYQFLVDLALNAELYEFAEFGNDE